jgi:Sulfotransferase family
MSDRASIERFPGGAPRENLATAAEHEAQKIYRARTPPHGDGAVFVFGVPRSGTTWLAKILDSHPDVLYRHEPDIVQPADRLPWLVPLEDVRLHLVRARQYLDQLAQVRSVKSVGPFPMFPKRHRTRLARLLRAGIALGLRVAERADHGGGWPQRITVPDLVSERYRSEVRVVIKSVVSFGRARLFAEAWPGSRIVVILRHPCGQVASIIRGVALGRFEDPGPPDELSRTYDAKLFGLRIERLESLSTAGRLAWHWAFANQKMLADLDGRSGVKIIRYEDLVNDPIHIARDVFAFAGLTWVSQTEAFIKRSTTASAIGGDRYYQIKRDAVQAANKWRELLSVEDRDCILDIVRRVPAGRLFPS